MSKVAVAGFLERVREDSSLRQRLRESPTPEVFVQEAAQAGFEFSAEE